MSRRDSKGIFATALGQIGENNEIPMPVKQGGGSPHLRRVAAGVRELQERSELANRLFNDSERIVDLDATLYYHPQFRIASTVRTLMKH